MSLGLGRRPRRKCASYHLQSDLEKRFLSHGFVEVRTGAFFSENAALEDC
jgi:hypothetical protein